MYRPCDRSFHVSSLLRSTHHKFFARYIFYSFRIISSVRISTGLSSGARGNLAEKMPSRSLELVPILLRKNSVTPSRFEASNGTINWHSSTLNDADSRVNVAHMNSSFLDQSTHTNRVDTGLNGSAIMHDNLFLHPEVHNPVRHPKHLNGKVNNGNGNFLTSVFGQTTIEMSPDEVLSEGATQKRLGRLFGPLIVLMSIVGLYHPSSEDVGLTRDACLAGASVVRYGLMVWNAVVALYVLFNVVVVGYYIDVRDGLHVLNVTELLVLMRMLNALLDMGLFFLVFESGGRYEGMLEAWTIWMRWRSGGNMGSARRDVLLITVCSVIFATIPSILIGLDTYGRIPGMALTDTAFAQQRLPDDTTAWNRGPRENFIVAMTVTNFIIACFIGFISAICAVLVHELRLLSREIRVEIRGQAVIWDMKIEPLSGQEVTTMEYLRRKHGKLVDVIEAVDNSFRELLFFHYLFGIPMLIFGLYVLFVTAPLHEISIKGTILLLAVLSILEMFFVWLWAVRVHIWAHQPVKIMPSLDIHERKEISHAHQTSLDLFLTRLTQDKIALSLWGIVPLTKQFFLAVLILVTTYLILLTKNSSCALTDTPPSRSTSTSSKPVPSLVFPPSFSDPSSFPFSNHSRTDNTSLFLFDIRDVLFENGSAISPFFIASALQNSKGLGSLSNALRHLNDTSIPDINFPEEPNWSEPLGNISVHFFPQRNKSDLLQLPQKN